LLQLNNYWLEQNIEEDITRIITITKYCKNGTLESYINNLSTLSKSENSHYRGLNYCSQLWAALMELHKQGYTHKDIKPSNVFIDQEEIKLGDFGLLNYPSKDSGSPVYMPKKPFTFQGKCSIISRENKVKIPRKCRLLRLWSHSN